MSNNQRPESKQDRLADLDRREARVRANANPHYRAVAKMCLAQIRRERDAVLAEA